VVDKKRKIGRKWRAEEEERYLQEVAGQKTDRGHNSYPHYELIES
jgi:hypothetical protein